jgi:hypothetical protein
MLQATEIQVMQALAKEYLESPGAGSRQGVSLDPCK